MTCGIRFASAAREQGKDRYPRAAETARPHNIETTMRYAHLTADAERAAAKDVANVLSF